MWFAQQRGTYEDLYCPSIHHGLSCRRNRRRAACRTTGAACRRTDAGRPSGATQVTRNPPPNRTVTFRLLAPKATEVTLNGSWDNGTDLKMTKDESGVWSTTIGPLAPQLWGYWFLADGVKALAVAISRTGRGWTVPRSDCWTSGPPATDQSRFHRATLFLNTNGSGP